MERWTLDDYLLSIFRNRQTQSDEFKCLLRIYGRERIQKAWDEFKALPDEKKQPDTIKSQPVTISAPHFSRYHPSDKDD